MAAQRTWIGPFPGVVGGAALFLGLLGVALRGPEPISAQAPSVPLSAGAWLARSGPSPYRGGVELVALDVCVTGKDGHAIQGLTVGDFIVLEDNQPQQISVFLTEDEVPLAVVMLVDRSYSMELELDHAKRAAVAFLEGLGPRDLSEVIVFNERLDRPVLLGLDRQAAIQAIDALSAKGQTSLYEALLVGMGDLTRARRGTASPRRWAIVLLSDGEDTASHITFEEVFDEARRGGVLVYVVSLRTDAKHRFIPVPYNIAQLAYHTGGRPVTVRDPESLGEEYEGIRHELSHLYRIGYVPARPSWDGSWHAVSVRVPGRKAVVRTRLGYLSPNPRRGATAR